MNAINTVNKALLHSLIIDEEYLLVGGHINENLRKLIEKGGMSISQSYYTKIK